MKTSSVTYALGRTAGLLVFLLPLVFNVLPAGFDSITLGAALHFVVTWLNEYAHSEPVAVV